MYRGVWWGNLKERGHEEDIGVDRMIKSNTVLQKNGLILVYWINLAQN